MQWTGGWTTSPCCRSPGVVMSARPMIDLTMYTCACPRCGSWYTASRQALTNPYGGKKDSQPGYRYPKAGPWQEVYQALLREQLPHEPGPPVPLILSGSQAGPALKALTWAASL